MSPTLLMVFAFIVTVTLVGLCSAQAPGDEASRCITGSGAPSYPDNVKILMDSRNYENLLIGTGSGFNPARNPVWRDASCDGNDITSATTPTYWQHGSGGLCTFQVQVCGHSQGDQDNWLFTQHISKAVPAADTYTVRVYFNISFNFRSCFDSNNCNPRFKLNRYFVNTQRTASTCSNRTLYSGSGIMPDNVFGPEANNLQVTYQRYFDMNTNRDGFYLALQDYSLDTADHHLRGTCTRITRFKVFRYECQEKLVGLVRYPGTQAPVSGTRSVTTQCLDNAHSVSSLSVTCDSTGFWGNQSPQCECDVGYIENSGSCQGCSAGTYSLSGNCETCPANTVTTEEATGECECVGGYFRNKRMLDDTCRHLLTPSTESSITECTAPPSLPGDVTVVAQSATQVRVTWSSPTQTGGRNDLYYMVEHSDPDSLGDFTGTTCKSSSATSHTFSSLRPATAYCVRVSAHNGVSDQDPDNAATRYADQCATTPEAAPGTVGEISGHCSVIVWKEPDRPNGRITDYTILLFTMEEEVAIETGSPQTFHVITSKALLPRGSPIFVTVSATNKAGKGNYTKGVYIGCEDPSEEIENNNNGTEVPLPEFVAGTVSNIEVIGDLIYWDKPPGRVSGYVVIIYTEKGQEEIETDLPYLKLTIPDGEYAIEVCTVIGDIRNCTSPRNIQTGGVQSEDSSGGSGGTLQLIIVAIVVFFVTAIVTAMLATCVFWIYTKKHSDKTSFRSTANEYEMKT